MNQADKINGDCRICDRISAIKSNNNPYLVAELDTGYVVIGDYQLFKGYTLFLCKEHKRELHELELKFRQKYLWEMSLVAEAVFLAFQPQKLNYELLGNTDQHMHWHIFPRHKNDLLPNNTIWNINKKIRTAETAKPNHATLEELKKNLKRCLDDVLKNPLYY